jgi:hypothetical protein
LVYERLGCDWQIATVVVGRRGVYTWLFLLP